MEPDILEHIVDGREKPTNLPFALLKNITEDFSEDRIIRQGGFATYYKGILPNRSVSVTRIRNSHTIDDKLFYREVDSLLSISHQNIVRFLGFCASTEQTAIKIEGPRHHIYAEIRERLLCFEYTSNGSLQEHISDELRGLDWNTRYQIIKGICEGLHHLHKERQIYHMDLKPANILLDNHMVPKITGFGLAKLDGKSQTMREYRYRSTGYYAPECPHSGRMSFKSDMFSLGIIITELVTGQKRIPGNNTNNVLRRWRHRWKKSGKETPLVYQQVAKCMEIGLLCQEIDPSKRPFMTDLINVLREMDNVNGTISNASEYMFGQISTCSDDEMLGIEPLELHFPFEINKHILCSFELTNEMAAYIAFNIRNTSSLKFFIEPKKGIVPPQSKCSVEIILRAQEKEPQYMQQAYAFILQSTKVKDELEAEDITAAMFKEKLHNVVDEVNLDVVFDTKLLQSERLDVHKLKISCPFEPDNKVPVVLTLEHLKAITDDFSTKLELGRGGYGVVYKSVYPSGEIVAVKKLFAIHIVQDDQFRDEVSHLMGIKHRNVVQTLGYCAETSWDLIPQSRGRPIWAETPKRLICFEYVPNKSLDTYISDESAVDLEWNLRYKIIKGICKGLHFLHEECHIVHLDLKPENILMDAAMVPKIADFGLSKIFGDQQTRLIIPDKSRAGSAGYMAPEYILHGIVSIRADIFSLGVIILQIVTGHRKYPLSSAYFKLFNKDHCPQSIETSFQDYTERVVGSWRKKFTSAPVYKAMEKCTMEKYMKQVKKCIDIALNCVDIDVAKRPTAKDVIQVLNGVDQAQGSHEQDKEAQGSHEQDKLKISCPFEPDNKIPVVLTLEHLKAITDDFSTKLELGRGRDGVAYKSVYPSGEIVAVKKLFAIHTVQDDQFRDEVSHLTGIKHINVVQTLGYCAETSWDLIPQSRGRPIWAETPKRLICFEYVPNKSLDTYISDESVGLEWNLRYKIIKGICRGLHFLHEECHIVHLDLKPENILMDAAMVPKIADFGLSKIFGDQQTRLIIPDKSRAGSAGYMAPEYILHGIVSIRADIFSLGVIILQIVTGHREYPLSSAYFKLFNKDHCPQSIETSFQDYTERVVGSWRKKFTSAPVYEAMEKCTMEKYMKQVKKCIDIALNCMDIDVAKRPTAKDVIQVLNGVDQDVYFDDESAEAAISSLRLGDD